MEKQNEHQSTISKANGDSQHSNNPVISQITPPPLQLKSPKNSEIEESEQENDHLSTSKEVASGAEDLPTFHLSNAGLNTGDPISKTNSLTPSPFQLKTQAPQISEDEKKDKIAEFGLKQDSFPNSSDVKPFQLKPTNTPTSEPTVENTSAPVIQLARDVEVAGVTHTVEPGQTPQGKRSIFEGRPVHTLKNKTKLVIDDTPKFVSRRGPNQEVGEHRELDEMASYTYPYFKVLKINGRDVSEDVYVRGDTIYEGGEIVAEPQAEHRERSSGEETGVSDIFKGLGKGVGKGILNAVFPILPIMDWWGNIKQIHKERKTETAPHGKSAWWSILSGSIETAQLVAAIATAVSIVSALVAFIPGAQAAAVAATVAGVIATIAHAVTAGLRIISMIRLAYRWKKASSTLRKAQAAKKFWGELAGFAGNAIGVIGGGLLGGFDVSSIGSASTAVSQGGATASNQVASTAASAGQGQIFNSEADAYGALGEFWQGEVKQKVDFSEANLLRYRMAKDAQEAEAQKAQLEEARAKSEELFAETTRLKEQESSLPETANSDASSEITEVDFRKFEEAEDSSKGEPLSVEVNPGEVEEGADEITESDFLTLKDGEYSGQGSESTTQGKFKPVVQRSISSWIKKKLSRLGKVKKAARKLYLKIKAKLIGKVLRLLGIEEPVKQAKQDLSDHLQVNEALKQETEAANTAMDSIDELDSKLGK